MHNAEVSRPGPPRPAQASVALWAGRIAVAPRPSRSAARSATPAIRCSSCCSPASAASRSRRRHPAAVVPGGRALPPGGLRPRRPRHPQRGACPDRDRPGRHRWCGWVAGRERFAVPRELLAFGALGLAYIAASRRRERSRRRRRRDARPGQLRRAIVALLMVLLDTPAWLRRAVWAVVAGVGLLARAGDRPAGHEDLRVVLRGLRQHPARGRRHAQRRPAEPQPVRPDPRHLGRARLLPRPHPDAPAGARLGGGHLGRLRGRA